MGATHVGRFMLVGSCAVVDGRSVAALETFLDGEVEIT
jgi:hypothetical protein